MEPRRLSAQNESLKLETPFFQKKGTTSFLFSLKLRELLLFFLSSKTREREKEKERSNVFGLLGKAGDLGGKWVCFSSPPHNSLLVQLYSLTRLSQQHPKIKKAKALFVLPTVRSFVHTRSHNRLKTESRGEGWFRLVQRVLRQIRSEKL